jgi:transposase
MVRYHTLLSLRELGRRAQYLDGQLTRLDELIVPLVTARAPGLLSLYGVGPDTAAMLLIAAGDHPARLRSEAAWAHLCAAAPIPASSGKTQNRHRLNRGGDRQANHALYAPRGALSYSRCSREKLGGRFLGLMANLASKD